MFVSMAKVFVGSLFYILRLVCKKFLLYGILIDVFPRIVYTTTVSLSEDMLR